MRNTRLQSTLQSEIADWFKALETVHPEDMIGLWKGSGHPSGHPLDGVLENLHWFGKRFHPDMRADALLFEGDQGELVAIEPAFFPIRWALRFASLGRTARARNLFSHLRPRLRAKGTTASLERRIDEGVLTTAMVYDRQPIVDFFRRSDDMVVGKMVVSGDPRPYFFRLLRV
ncbi:GXWXG domain-containing protein [Aliirhizobium cellulosilyticum]|uniref:DUF4334 domain-containing protein n=1 Tax=Aliirhizobium cellulosilyticum TaxID=393664 RepID=A0A7W6SAH8_9HYPH|nr:GXWXG domain-containing protein [Rhizobium cellulosilyticum]MBB4349468.1 hypothetical protein [Rhizobium cellulosilyticum]MBB4412310.1 hypothetical protein [Rhizobium cellulosilyticum]MBB4446941.1 hypothetical protein [Rhizobium cellulosilyticum]